MNASIFAAQKLSRELAPITENLTTILAAEEQIADVSDADLTEIESQCERSPTDPFWQLWYGLSMSRRQRWPAAIEAFSRAIEGGCTHWRVGWYIAQAARHAGLLEVVDQACAAVLKANPQFWFARELPKHARGYYSQIGQDKVIEQFFQKIAPRTKTFVEVGAFDGVHYSNVRRLHEKHGWSGISFEPVTKNYRKLCAAYAGTSVKCVQAAVSTQDGELEINVSTYPHLPDWGSDVATLGEADTKRWEREYGATWEREKVPVRRLSRLLDEADVADFDFISIDTEGHDLEVLRSIDFKRYHPLLIVIEYGENKAAIGALLEREGYGVLQDNGIDFVACPRVLPRQVKRPPAPAAARMIPPGKPSTSEQIIARFFAHQPPRTKRFLEIGVGMSHVGHLADRLGWSGSQIDKVELLRNHPEMNAGTCDVLSLTEPDDVAAALRSVDLGALGPQLVSAAYGRSREIVFRLLAEQGYSPLADNDGVLLMARFAAMALGDNHPETRNFTGLSGKPAYNEIEDEFQQNLHGWLEKNTDDIERIVIVGGCFGLEVGRFLSLYPKAEIHVFEPSQRHFPRLQATYGSEPRVKCHRLAVSDHAGVATFHEGSLQGVGSLLPPCDRSQNDAWVPFEAQETFEVKLVTLDEFSPLAGKPIDLLWCDVQGAELQVLRGARDTLSRCQAIFLEVANTKITYQGQCRFPELDRCCHEAGFYLAGIGLCPSGNGTGNAAWLRSPVDRRDEEVQGERRSVPAAELPALLRKLQPHLLELNYLPLEREVRIGSVPASELLTPERFDLTAKYLYGLHRELGVQSRWARELYHAHIRAFSEGTCREGDGSKAGIEDYIRSFDALLDDIKANGFDTARTLVPIARGNVLIDGAHRTAACLVHRRRVGVLQFDRDDERFGYRFFQKRGLNEAACDAMALEYCRLRPDTFVVTIFPAAVGRDEEVRDLLEKHGRIVYAKQVSLNRRGARNLIREIYTGEPWLGDWRNGFAGADGKMRPCFGKDGPVRVFVFQAVGLEAVRNAKTVIRALFGIENHSVHINDTHAQTLQLAQLFLNANSIHFLNHAEPRFLERFVRHMERYRKWLGQTGASPEHFCIDGSAVMAAYGLRDAQDLDVLHFGEADFRSVMPEVNSHNPDAHHHVISRDEIIFDPANHFHAFGLKFAALHVIRALKVKRDEGKDRKDVALIDRCAGADSSPVRQAALMAPKIIGLIPARNEAARLPFCLRALKPYVDAVVYLDDCSDDDSVRVVESLASECRVEKIIRKTIWHRDEPGDRNALLRAGRELGGTHFVVLDADEAFTANCARDGYLRRLLLSLRPGDSLALNWIQLWRSLKHYRFDASQWTYAARAFAFCDDGRAAYQSGFIHTLRVPQGLAGRTVPVVNYIHGVMHFQFVDWPNLQIKQSWYRCMERVRQPKRSIAEINAQYAPSEDEEGLLLREVPADWFAGFGELDTSVFSVRDDRRVREVLGWFREKGVANFEALDIWRVDWAALTDNPDLAAEISRHAAARVAGAAKLTPAAKQHMAAANACLSRGDIGRCRTAIESALHEAPGHPEILSALGNVLLITGRAADAIKHFEASLKSDPNQPRVWAQLASAQRKANNPAGVLNALQRAFELDTDCPDAFRVLAEVHTERGRHREAVGAYRKLVSLAPRDVRVLVQLGRALVASGEPEEGRQAFQRALELDPANRAARDALAQVAGSSVEPATATMAN